MKIKHIGLLSLLLINSLTFAQTFQLENSSEPAKEPSASSKDPIFDESISAPTKNEDILFTNEDDGLKELYSFSSPILDAFLSNNFQLAAKLSKESPATKIDGMNNSLCYASLNGYVGYINEALPAKSALTSSSCNNGVSPIGLAARKNNTEVLKKMLEIYGQTQETKTSKNAKQVISPILDTVQYTNKADSLSLLIKSGFKVNVADSNGSTPLHYAAALSKDEHWLILIDAGADINAKDKYGKTPMYYLDKNFSIFQIAKVYNSLPTEYQAEYDDKIKKIGTSVSNIRR